MIVRNHTQNIVLGDDIGYADSFLARATGLLGRPALGQGQGLIITRCRSIHMFFMKFSIDVLFIDGKDVVVGVCESVPPWSLSPVFWQARQAVELPAGIIAKTRTKIGDRIEILKKE